MTEQFAEKVCCTTCKNINHSCKEKCECWTFAKKGFLAGFKACAKERLNVTTISDCLIKDDQLTKAKEIIKQLMYASRDCIAWYCLCDKAKQFLKEIEK